MLQKYTISNLTHLFAINIINALKARAATDKVNNRRHSTGSCESVVWVLCHCPWVEVTTGRQYFVSVAIAGKVVMHTAAARAERRPADETFIHHGEVVMVTVCCCSRQQIAVGYASRKQTRTE